MTCRPLLLVAAALLSCRSHPEGAALVRQEDCAGCHRADYLAASDPVHAGRMPERCAECHTIDGWRPAVDLGHPEADFPIARGDHGGILCIDCHDPARGPETAGENADCTGCHTGAHQQATMAAVHGGVADYRFEAAAPSFCLRCHPDGQADAQPDSA
ncbi:MAG TPA: hypothetical protein VFU21_00670, partial [Kofleriaceae bacterium]|nr:hypothetical protein [Kofleriaceae bacterium]